MANKTTGKGLHSGIQVAQTSQSSKAKARAETINTETASNSKSSA